MRVSGELYGEWDRLDRILHNLRDNRSEYHLVVRTVSEKISESIKALIESQSISLEPLVAEYREQKKKDGYGDKILVRTGDFVRSIQVTDITVNGYDISVKVGIRGGRTRTNISMEELAGFLEYGTSKMKGREPIRKSWDKIKEDVKAEVMSILRQIILEDLK